MEWGQSALVLAAGLTAVFTGLTAWFIYRQMTYGALSFAAAAPARPVLSRFDDGSRVILHLGLEHRGQWYISKVAARPRRGRLQRMAHGGKRDQFNAPVLRPSGEWSRTLAFDGSDNSVEMLTRDCESLEITITSFALSKRSIRFTQPI